MNIALRGLRRAGEAEAAGDADRPALVVELALGGEAQAPQQGGDRLYFLALAARPGLDDQGAAVC